MIPSGGLVQPDPEVPDGAVARGKPWFGDQEVHGYERSPADVLRLVVFSLVSLLLLALTAWATDAVVAFESDLVGLFGFVTPTVERVLSGVTQILIGATALATFVIPVVTRRFRLLGYLLAASVAAWVVVSGIEWWLDRRAPDLITDAIAARAGINGSAFPKTSGLAVLVAAFVVIGPFVTRRWRRSGAAIVAALTLLELLVAVHPPSDLFAAMALGAMVGVATLLCFGRPTTKVPLGVVASSLQSAGLSIATLEPAKVDARGSTPYFATLDDGGRIFAKVLGTDERAADLLFRIYRLLRYKNLGDERPFSSLRRTVEHEAMVSLQARDVGVRTPRLRAIAEAGTDSMLLAYDVVAGASLDRIEETDVDDDMLTAIWEQVKILRQFRIAHRDLRQANLFVDDEMVPWLIDFGFSEVAATEELLEADVAQLLSSLAVKVGSERAVKSAVAVLGPAVVGASLPRLQANALSGATRTALKDHPGLLKELQVDVTNTAGLDEPEFERLQRVSGKTVLTIGMLVALVYFLVPQLTDVPGILERVKDANWVWVPLVLLGSMTSYLGATLSTTGSVPDRLRFGPTSAAQVAASFAGRLAPSSLGGMALNVRYLEKAGVDSPVAVSGVGLNTVGGLLTHVVLLVLFLVWAGREAFGSFKLPNPEVFVVGISVVAAMAVVAFAVPSVRAAVVGKLVPILRRSASGIGAVLHRPSKLLLLVGGSALVTLSYIVSMYFATIAFGGHLRFAQVGAIYLAGSAVAIAAPTPGGLGALEAALIAGFVAAGMANTVAVPAVFLYRLATFWLPIFPGWLSFRWLRRKDFL